MSFYDLAYLLATRSISIQGYEGKLAVKAPIGAVTPEIRAALAEHKPSLMTETPWRGIVAALPIDARQEWADLAETGQAAGLDWRNAEIAAFLRVYRSILEREAAGEFIEICRPEDTPDPWIPGFDELPGAGDIERAMEANQGLSPPRETGSPTDRQPIAPQSNFSFVGGRS
jgi:hypothetical protein